MFLGTLFLKKVMYHPADTLEELNEYYYPQYEKITDILDVSTPEEIDYKMKQIDKMYNHDLKVLQHKLLHKKKYKKDNKITERVQAMQEFAKRKQQEELQQPQTQVLECKTEVIQKTEMLEEGEEDEE